MLLCASVPGADNLIPMELALKIASEFKGKKRFAVYVVLPKWPEGDPKTEAMQEILFWQGHLKYPVQIGSDGKVSSLPECENFPNAGSKILGSHSPTIPDILTT